MENYDFAVFFAVALALCCGANGSPAAAVLSLKPVGEVQAPPRVPDKCCLPKQWSADMIILDTINTEKTTLLKVQMDYDRKIQAMLNFTGSFETPQTQNVIDYGKHILYVVPLKYPQYCQKIPLPLPMVQCIPDDAEYLGSSFLGSMGSAMLPYNGWRMRFDMSGFKVIYTMAVSQKGCVPLVDGVAYPQAPAMNQLFMFSEFQANLTDPSVFDLPPSCTK